MTDKHPTYGKIVASRWSCGGRGRRLFGSSLPGHNTGITLTIHEASREFTLGDERISSAGGRILCEVNLSPVQWAEMLTSMNMGDGVPCTVVHVLGDGGRRGEPPVTASVPERVRGEYATMLRERAHAIAESRKELAAKMAGKVSAGLAKEIDAVLARAQQDITENAPFYVEQFTAATDRVVVAAKSEVDAAVTHVAQKLGLDALRDGGIRGLLGMADDDAR